MQDERDILNPILVDVIDNDRLWSPREDDFYELQAIEFWSKYQIPKIAVKIKSLMSTQSKGRPPVMI